MGEFAQVAVGKPVGDRSDDRGSCRPHALAGYVRHRPPRQPRAHSSTVSSPKLTASVERGSRTHIAKEVC
jgi:hypothetical protein